MKNLALFALLGAFGMLLAGEAQTPPKAPDKTPVAASATTPYLGVKIDEAGALDAKGLSVEQVVPGSTAADLDIRKGDRMVAVNSQKLINKDDLARILGTLKIGDEIEIQVTRSGEEKPLNKKGKLAERLSHESIWQILNKNSNEARELKALVAAKGTKQLSLPAILERLKDIELALPGAIEEFKKQYPAGDFSFSLHIDIVSDRNAKNPVTVNNQVKGESK